MVVDEINPIQSPSTKTDVNSSPAPPSAAPASPKKPIASPPSPQIASSSANIPQNNDKIPQSEGAQERVEAEVKEDERKEKEKGQVHIPRTLSVALKDSASNPVPSIPPSKPSLSLSSHKAHEDELKITDMRADDNEEEPMLVPSSSCSFGLSLL